MAVLPIPPRAATSSIDMPPRPRPVSSSVAAARIAQSASSLRSGRAGAAHQCQQR
jgi:hypothetical protein